MTARIIDGKAIAADIRQEVARGVASLQAGSQPVTPGLAAILVGDDPASQVYVGSKEKAANEAGMNSWVHRLPATATQTELMDLIRKLNDDPAVHGILLQLPLPADLDAEAAIDILDGSKDVDGLTAASHGRLALGRTGFVPCTPLGIQVLLDRSGIQVGGAHAVVVGRSNLVGRPISTLLSLKSADVPFATGQTSPANATVTLCHTGTTDLAAFTRSADILVVAAGRARSITADMVKPGATVIDVGINRGEDGKLAGDVDFEPVAQVAGAITPVPGGVGPMTVAMLMSNTLTSAALRL
ncbi:MAG: bifunctional 5,10-methylenetetrahydrofolate dehydrogenase/5,10-methenyltetrahydrofolate cyclohydrolase [Actinomycetota bacterium]